MSKISEIRDKAHRLLWQSRWLNRFMFLIVIFNLLRYIAINIAVSFLGSTTNILNERIMSAETPQEILALFGDAPFRKAFIVVMALSLFVAAVMNSIAEFGISRVRLEVARGNTNLQWHKVAFGGFLDPFGMFALGLLHAIFVWWPILFIVIPAMICLIGTVFVSGVFSPAYLAAIPFAAISVTAFYRYRQAWFLKANHSDWSALKCLRESDRMMKGHKWRNFLLDCSFWRPITFMLATAMTASILTLVNAPDLPMLLVTLLITALSLYLSAYIPLGQAVFHLELAKAGDSNQ